MNVSTRRPNRIFTVFMWLLSFVFAIFLTGFGALVIADLPKIDGPPLHPDLNSISVLRAQELRIFLFRLALTLPLLALSAYFIKTKRGSPYWPLYRGFILFALVAFFIELVPYLPSYGGYVRYFVGICLVALVGIYATRSMNIYLERKRQEEARSEKERRSDLDYEVALKKIAANTCPGCDRKIEQRSDVNTFFCVHCGLRLRKKCGSCGETNMSFHQYCLSCGASLESTLGAEDTKESLPA